MKELDRVNEFRSVININDEVDGAHDHKWKPSCQGDDGYNERRDSETLTATLATVTSTLLVVKIASECPHSGQEDRV